MAIFWTLNIWYICTSHLADLTQGNAKCTCVHERSKCLSSSKAYLLPAQAHLIFAQKADHGGAKGSRFEKLFYP